MTDDRPDETGDDDGIDILDGVDSDEDTRDVLEAGQTTDPDPDIDGEEGDTAADESPADAGDVEEDDESFDEQVRAWGRRHATGLKLLVFAGVTAVGLFALWTNLGLLLDAFGLLGLFTFSVGFLIAVGFLPLVCLGIPSAVPAIIAEVMANALWLLGSFAHGPMKLYQLASGEYEIRRADPEDFEPKRNRSQFLGVDFVLDFERDPDRFGNLIEHYDAVTDGGRDKLIEYGPVRAGIQTVLDPSEPGPYIRIHQLLGRLQKACGIRDIDRKQQTALTEHAGDDGMSDKWQTIGIIATSALGALMGWLTLF